MTYWICFACGDGIQFNDEKTFLEHLRSKHTSTILPDQIPALVKLSQRTTPTEISRCPLCNWPEEGVKVDKEVLLNHIAKDIHSFSLRALPWADDNGQERDERIHDSSEKVYEWLVNNKIQECPTLERPLLEKRSCSGYFQQNAYFAESSKGSSSSDPDSETSRVKELEELRKEGETIIHEGKEQQDESDEDPVLNTAESRLGDYTVGWISALPAGYVIAKAFLDEVHDNSLLRNSNMLECSFGRIGNHNIVIASSPTGEHGQLSAARIAEVIMNNLPNIRLCLMVGIGSGVPSQSHDIRLGDVVVGKPERGHGGGIYFDFGKATQSQDFRSTGYFGEAPGILRVALESLHVQYELEGHKLEATADSIFERFPWLRKNYQRPDPASDRLYQSHIVHPADNDLPCTITCGDDPSCLVSRAPRGEDDDNPAIHYGLIASANRLMKDASIRDKFGAENDVLCFEMEAAGLMNHFPCLLIRGICDYADSHKNKDWQGYAAIMAAAYAKDLLYKVSGRKVLQQERAIDLMKKVDDDVDVTFRSQNYGLQVGRADGNVFGSRSGDK